MKIVVTEPIPAGEYTLVALSAVPPPPEPEPAPEPQGPWLAYRTSEDSEKLPLEDATVSGSLWISLEGYDGPGPVVFALNGAIHRTENNAPWDFAGSSSWDSLAVSDGVHRVSAAYGGDELGAAFVVDNVAEEVIINPPPEPESAPPPTAKFATVIAKDGISWFFDNATATGPFVNGDPWVPPGVVSEVQPRWDGSRGGSMVNLVRVGEATTELQGFDANLTRFGDAYRARFPLALQAGQSLVSTWSWRAGEPGCPDVVATENMPRPTLRHAAVLTCLAQPPPPGSFRPPYAGSAKPLYNVSTMIDVADLQLWPLPSGAPSVGTVIGRTSRLWLNFREMYHTSYIRPHSNIEFYGRDLAADLGDAMLLLLCNIPLADKQTLARNLIQIAIDQYGVFETGYVSGRDKGGISVGWHGALVIGGYLLQAPEIRDYFIGKPVKTTQEMAQIDKDEQGTYWRESDRFTRASPGSKSYRTCCSSNGYIGHVLAARALGLEDAWGHPNTFEYHDEYMKEMHSRGSHYASHAWHRALWESTDGGRRAP